MEGYLNRNKLAYVLSFLNLNYEVSHLIKERRLQFNYSSDVQLIDKPCVFFILSENAFDIDKVCFKDEIPVLFPGKRTDDWYYFKDGSLYFADDLLKSVFYLISGYQELGSENLDSFGRFSFTGSLQEKLGIVQKPIVNYYFDIIVNGLEKFSEMHNMPAVKKKLFQKSVFFLSHDIDLVRFYTFNNLLLKIKQFFGLTRSFNSKRALARHFFEILLNLIKLKRKDDPYWNFDFMCSVEKKLDFKSSFYFLHKDLRHHDSYYSFSDPHIRSLIKFLKEEGFEIGLHGSTRTTKSYQKLKWQKNKLGQVTNSDIKGIRQHRLLYDYPVTTKIHQKAGFLYDSTLGFAQHEGFRNSYCYPFKLYDFENDRPFKIWKIPLNIMDTTLFAYRKHGFHSAFQSVKCLQKEVSKFNGVLSLLWHNSFFDEDAFRGITEFYIKLLNTIHSSGSISMTGEQIAEKMDQHYEEIHEEHLSGLVGN